MKEILNLQSAEDMAAALELVNTAAGRSLGEPILIDHGYINQVLMYEKDGLVARFPRSPEGTAQLSREAINLGIVATLDLSVEVPKLLNLAEAPVWMLTSLVPGIAHSRVDIHAWDNEHKHELGTSLADFLFALHTKLTPQQLPGDQEPLLEQFAADITGYEHEDELRTVAGRELSKLRDMTAQTPTTLLALYGDIHGANLIFNESLLLTGVVDFADMHPGTIYEELRRVYMLDPEVFASAKVQYEKRIGSHIDEELVRQWAIVHELSVLCRHAHEPQYPSIARARAHLADWKVL